LSFKTKKSLGQHFLTDKNIISKIYHSVEAPENSLLIEIGPGTGAITNFFVEKYSNYKVIELDNRAIEVLRDKHPTLEIIEQDVLKVDWAALIDGFNRVTIIGNLPYYITSPILFNILEIRHSIDSAYFMIQKEVAERIIANPSTKDYGILSVQTQLMSSPEILFNVSPNSFSPPPKVESSVIKLTFDRETLNCSDQNLKKVVRTAFNQRRKKLSNALKTLLGDILPDNFNFDERADHWTPDIYEKLTEVLEKNGTLDV